MKKMRALLGLIAVLAGFSLTACAHGANGPATTSVTVNWIPGGPLHGHEAQLFLVDSAGYEIAVGSITGVNGGPTRVFTMIDSRTGEPAPVTGDYFVRFILGPETRSSVDPISITRNTTIPFASLPIAADQ